MIILTKTRMCRRYFCLEDRAGKAGNNKLGELTFGSGGNGSLAYAFGRRLTGYL